MSSKRLECEICEFSEYVDFTVFPTVTERSWSKEFCQIESRFLYFCSEECEEDYHDENDTLIDIDWFEDDEIDLDDLKFL